MRITTQIVQVADGSVLASSRYDHEMEDIFVIQQAISRSVVEAVEARLGGTITRDGGIPAVATRSSTPASRRSAEESHGSLASRGARIGRPSGVS